MTDAASYRAEPEADRLIRPLDAMTLIYQRRSGITHIVAEPVPEILDAMANDALTAADLAARLRAAFEIGDDDALKAVVAARLEELAALGLVERLPVDRIARDA